MSEGPSDADKIRNKRLAKLGNQQPAAATNGESNTASTEELPHKQPTPKNQEQNPFNALGVKPQQSNTKSTAINIRPAEGTSPRPRSQDPQRPQAAPRSRDETPETWEHNTLSSLFRISLDPARKVDSHNHSLHYAESAAQELGGEGKPKKLTAPSEDSTGSLDSCIADAAASQGKTKPLEYLLQCWKRITRLNRTIKNGPPDANKIRVVGEARRLCMSYSIFAVTIPEMFDTPEVSPSFLPYLLADVDAETGLDFDWLEDATARIEDEPDLKDKLVETVEQMSRELSTKSMNDDYRPYLQGLTKLLRFNPLIAAISESPMFYDADIPAEKIETNTILGPYFRLSTLQDSVAQSYFGAAKTRDRGFIVNSQASARMAMSQHQASLYDIVERFTKVKSAREKLLDWFALTVNTNHRRRAIQVDHKAVSSDGFMLNVTVCLDRLCEPFMDASFSKINRIDIDYLRRSPRVKIDDETKINADQSTSDKFYEQSIEGESNFISEVFFLCAASHHYGTEAAQSKLDDILKGLKRMDKQIEEFEAERAKYESSPMNLAIFDQRIKTVKEQQDMRYAVHYATEGVLLDEQLQARAMSFMRYIIVWLMRIVSGVDFPKQKITLPLPAKHNEAFECLPEYFLEDVVDHFKFVTMTMPHVISPTQCEELVYICITFLESSEYIKNPGLKSGMVMILLYGIMPSRASNTGALGGLLNSLPFATSYLLHALMKAFIECESTGSHTQFYDKFNIRSAIFRVVKTIWSNTVYRDQLGQQASKNVNFFVRFVNLLLNDATFLLDECFSSFHKITELEKEIKSDAFASLSDQDRTQKEELLTDTKGKAKSYMPIVKETLQMLKMFTEALADSFTKAEVVQRLADMMDYNLDAMVGPKKNTLRINNMAEYNFHPASMLSDIADVFLNLAHKPSFLQAIAKDGRSYRPSNFEEAEKILRTRSIRAPEELAAWTKLAKDIEAAKAALDAEEEDLGDIPDEFEDPLLGILMMDPVILPMSRQTVDRSCIQQHLLSEETDPFNRSPLKIEDVLPNTELKAKIDAWIAEKKAKKVAPISGTNDADAMDTSQ